MKLKIYQDFINSRFGLETYREKWHDITPHLFPDTFVKHARN